MIRIIVISIFIATSLSAAPEVYTDMFKTYCISCHGEEKQKGKVRLDNIKLLESPKLLADIIYVLEEKEMPTKKAKKKLPEDVRKAALEELYKLNFPAITLKRKTREEYINTVNDLFGTNFNLNDLLPKDSSDHDFNKIADEQKMSPHQVQSYLNTARFIAERILPEKKVEMKTMTFDVKHFRGSKKGDYRAGDKFILSTHYPWRSNLHISLEESTEAEYVKRDKILLCESAAQTYKRLIVQDYGRYRYDVKYEILKSKMDQVIGINLGDPRYPTNFKKIKRVDLPVGKNEVSFEVLMFSSA